MGDNKIAGGYRFINHYCPHNKIPYRAAAIRLDGRVLRTEEELKNIAILYCSLEGNPVRSKQWKWCKKPNCPNAICGGKFCSRECLKGKWEKDSIHGTSFSAPSVNAATTVVLIRRKKLKLIPGVAPRGKISFPSSFTYENGQVFPKTPSQEERNDCFYAMRAKAQCPGTEKCYKCAYNPSFPYHIGRDNLFEKQAQSVGAGL